MLNFFILLGGMYDKRPINISAPMFCKWMLRQSNPIARRDIQYLFHLSNSKDMKNIDSGIYAALKTSKLGNLNKKTFLEKIRSNDQKLECNLSTVLSAIRGSNEYWSRICGDLQLMDEVFGPATFFLSLSCAEYSWEDCKRFLHLMNGDIKGVKSCNIQSLVSSDPVSTSMFFHCKFEAFFNEIILNKNGPLGEVIHYFCRLEYQSRGAPHMHIKLWIKDAPVHGINNDKEIIDFINKHIKCELPNNFDNPLLFELVKQFQIHNCTGSCKRLVKKNKKCLVKCRYGFPRRIMAETTINTLEESVKSTSKGAYIL